MPARSARNREMLRLEQFVADVLGAIVVSALRAGIAPARVARLYLGAADSVFEQALSLTSDGKPTRLHRDDDTSLRAFIEGRAALITNLRILDAGALLLVESVASLLGKDVASVLKEKSEGRLLAFQRPSKSVDLFPVFQFEGTKVAPWVPKLIASVGNGLAALHFLTMERKGLMGSSYLKSIQGAANGGKQNAIIATMLEVACHCTP